MLYKVLSVVVLVCAATLTFFLNVDIFNGKYYLLNKYIEINVDSFGKLSVLRFSTKTTG